MCECLKFRTARYDSTPYRSDARPVGEAHIVVRPVRGSRQTEHRVTVRQQARRDGVENLVVQCITETLAAGCLPNRERGAVADVVEIGWWRSLWFVQRTISGV